MKRTLSLLFALTSLACATTTPVATPAPAPSLSPAAVADCDPGHSILNDTLWVQTSAD